MSNPAFSRAIQVSVPAARASIASSRAPDPASRTGPAPSERTASRAGAIRGARTALPSGPKAAKKTLPRRASIAAATRPGFCSRIRGAARAARVETPVTGILQATPIARAAAIPTRSPVKDPGPTVTATRPSDAKPPSTRAMTRSINGKRASAWPRSIAIVSIASGLSAQSAQSSRTQAEIAGSAVSIANIFMGQCSKLAPTSVERGERTGRSPGN